MPKTDNLELLLPDATQPCIDRARRLVSVWKLMIDEARAEDAGRVALSLERATEAFEHHVIKEVKSLLVELLRVFLMAELSGKGGGKWFMPVGGTGVPEACWGALEEYRAERPWLAGVPAPNQSALSVAERLQGSLERLVPRGELGRCQVELWRARWLFASGAGAQAVELLEVQLKLTEGSADRAVLVQGLTELHLERGAVRLATHVLEDHRDVSLCEEGLLELRAICSLLMGEVEEARSIRALLPHSRRSLPRSIAELRQRVPEWARWLPGSAEVAATDGASLKSEAFGRIALGAGFLAVFRPVPGRESVLVHSEVSPGWRRRLESWLASRGELGDTIERLEQELVATASVLVVHCAGRNDLREALGASDARALALCPLLDAFGEVRAWLHLEFEHHLVPATETLQALARAWADKLASELPADSGLVRTLSGDGAWRPGGECTESCDDSDPRALFFRSFALELGMKTSRRQWWGFVLEAGVPRWITSGGGALGDCGNRPGGGRSLSRVQRCGVPIRFDDPDPSLSLHADSASGVVLPMVLSGRTVGCFVVESERRRDFRKEDLRRYLERAGERVVALQAARFRSWHKQRFGIDLFFDVDRRGFGRSALDFALAGRVDEAVVLSGPEGSGKEVLARWLHFERAEGAGQLDVLRGGATPDEEVEAELARYPIEMPETEDGSPHTLLVKHLEKLSSSTQQRLLRTLEAPGSSLRIIVTLSSSLAECVAEGSLVCDLASRLSRLEFFVPALLDRRADIPGMIQLATSRFASEFGVPEPTWNDSAVALLWRQPWTGNVRELESMIYKLVLLHPGESLEVEHVRQLAGRFRLKLLKRLPSRHPRLMDLLSALRVTRKGSGNPNKTRAALYLGWDPDTLLVRLKEAGVDPNDPPFEWAFEGAVGSGEELAPDSAEEENLSQQED